MNTINLKFEHISYNLPFSLVKGTEDKPFLFGAGNGTKEVMFKDFWMAQYTVTQSLWEHIMGHNPSGLKHREHAVEHVSFNDIVSRQGFLEKINSHSAKEQVYGQLSKDLPWQFRLPSETEWEYAAKGGPHWTDNFIYSGSNTIDEVAWYQDNSGNESHPVGQKKPNQLGIYDMSGNLWEWCEDYFQEDISKIPADGSPFTHETSERVLRGGCFHNWAIHCTSTKRYAIGPECKDPCISFRLVLSF